VRAKISEDFGISKISKLYYNGPISKARMSSLSPMRKAKDKSSSKNSSSKSAEPREGGISNTPNGKYALSSFFKKKGPEMSGMGKNLTPSSAI